MTILDVFNETLKEVPSISKDLEDNCIRLCNWSSEKKQQATRILQQLQHKELLTCGKCLGHEYVELTELSLTLTPRECGIYDDDIFTSENISEAYKYVKSLLADINECSPKINFYICGYIPNKGKFYISWKF